MTFFVALLLFDTRRGVIKSVFEKKKLYEDICMYLCDKKKEHVNFINDHMMNKLCVHVRSRGEKTMYTIDHVLNELCEQSISWWINYVWINYIQRQRWRVLFFHRSSINFVIMLKESSYGYIFLEVALQILP